MCPDCGASLIILEYQGVEIDYCVDCHGSWLDAGELELIFELDGIPMDRFAETLRRAQVKRRDERKCPRCQKKMDVITLCEEKPVELDRCPDGHGLWFDQGEIEQIVHVCTGGEEGHLATFFSTLYPINSASKWRKT
jgi:Zn-finger nucleic acid-binding protein